METHRGLSLDGLGLPGRGSRLQRAIRDQISFRIGRRWSRRLDFRSVQVPEMLDQATPREGGCEICYLVAGSSRCLIKLRFIIVRLGAVIISKIDFYALDGFVC